MKHPECPYDKDYYKNGGKVSCYCSNREVAPDGSCVLVWAKDIDTICPLKKGGEDG